jgi:RimJ/RimL family protein N-acetyltransferase
VLVGNTVALRPFDRRHLDRTLRWNNDADLCYLLGRWRPVSDLEHDEWFREVLAREDVVFFSIETRDGDRHIGNVWLSDIEPRHRKAEVRIVIGESIEQGKGAGSQALALISDYAFGALNLSRVYAYVLGINPRAKRAFERAGFALEGVLRADRWSGDRFIDVFLLGKLRDDRRAA